VAPTEATAQAKIVSGGFTIPTKISYWAGNSGTCGISNVKVNGVLAFGHSVFSQTDFS